MLSRIRTEAQSMSAISTGYWNQSRRPLASFYFVLPLIICYEFGSWWLGDAAVRNGADIWMQQLLVSSGFVGWLLLPVLTLTILLAWHHATGQPWRISSNVIYTMVAESAVFALILLAIAHVQTNVLSIAGIPASCEIPLDQLAHDTFSRIVRYFGAGVYEELLFRLMLIPLVMAAVGLAIASRRIKIIAALFITSVLFAIAHYLGPNGDHFDLASFSFRALAGAFFAVLFIFRGFGIAAGTHALYDMLVGFPTP